MRARFFKDTIATGQRGIGKVVRSSRSLSAWSRNTDCGRIETYPPDETIVVRKNAENVVIMNSGGGNPASRNAS